MDIGTIIGTIVGLAAVGFVGKKIYDHLMEKKNRTKSTSGGSKSKNPKGSGKE